MKGSAQAQFLRANLTETENSAEKWISEVVQGRNWPRLICLQAQVNTDLRLARIGIETG